MATTISEEVSARFTADTTGLVKAVDQSKAKLAELRKAYSARTAAGEVKNTILNPQLLADKGLDKLIGSMKIGAVTGGVLAAGLSIAANALSAFKDEADEANKATLALDENVRKLTNASTFTSSAEGANSLAGRVAELREQDRQLRADQDRLNPADPFGQAKLNSQYYLTRGSPGDFSGQGALANDRAKNASQQTLVEKDIARIQGQIGDSLQRQTDLTKGRLDLDQQSARIADLQLDRERELNELKASGAGTPENQRKINERYDLEINAQDQLRTAMEQRYNTQLGIVSLQTSALNADQQAYVAAQARVKQVDAELQLRKDITTEERRSMALSELGDRNAITQAQRSAVMESPAARNRRFYNESRRASRLSRADARLSATDGLVDIQRDINGRITGGRDIVSGLLRPVSPGFYQAEGLQTSSLKTGDLKGGGNDVDKGSTLLSATRAVADGVDISNRYLENISNQLDNLKFG